MNWKPTLGFEGYSVSDTGIVRNDRTGKIIRGALRYDGYTNITMGRGKTKTLHTLVLEAHVGPRPPDMIGLHKNDVRSDNRLSNLEWGTHKENSVQMLKNQRARGVDAGAATLTRDQVVEICSQLDAGEKLLDIATRLDVHVATISSINVGGFWAWLTGRSKSNAVGRLHKNRYRKLTDDQVLAITERIRQGEEFEVVGRDFGVSDETARQVAYGRLYSDVPREPVPTRRKRKVKA